jgi:hypothetical protein
VTACAAPVCWLLLSLQLIELLTTFVEKPQYKAQVQAALKEMMYTTIAYLQMTQVCVITHFRTPWGRVSDSEN